ncbi:MAG: MBL fold metallo-hydrolase [Chloroflexota bacterium]
MPDGDASSVQIAYLGHASLLIELDGLRFLTDPVLGHRLGPLVRHGPQPDVEAIGAVDAVLVSHAHPDHFHAPSIARLRGDPLLVVPAGLGSGARKTGRRVSALARGEQIRLGQWTIEAVPARHWRWPMEPHAAAVGYVLDGPARIYFAGDTAPYRRLPELVGRVDVALLPVGSWGPHRSPGHLDPRSAAVVAESIGARLAVPIHWGTFYPPLLDRIWRGPHDEPGPRFAREAARLAPRTVVSVLRPGASIEVTVRPGEPVEPAARPR